MIHPARNPVTEHTTGEDLTNLCPRAAKKSRNVCRTRLDGQGSSATAIAASAATGPERQWPPGGERCWLTRRGPRKSLARAIPLLGGLHAAEEKERLNEWGRARAAVVARARRRPHGAVQLGPGTPKKVACDVGSARQDDVGHFTHVSKEIEQFSLPHAKYLNDVRTDCRESNSKHAAVGLRQTAHTPRLHPCSRLWQQSKRKWQADKVPPAQSDGHGGTEGGEPPLPKPPPHRPPPSGPGRHVGRANAPD